MNKPLPPLTTFPSEYSIIAAEVKLGWGGRGGEEVILVHSVRVESIMAERAR